MGTNIDRIGRKVVEPRGYVLVYVGVEHHLADVRGYAYEHRLKAEEKLNRRLLPGEIVHHDNEIKGDNDAGNLVETNRPAHVLMHNPRLGTGSDYCGKGHLRKTNSAGRKRCTICENASERERYRGNKK